MRFPVVEQHGVNTAANPLVFSEERYPRQTREDALPESNLDLQLSVFLGIVTCTKILASACLRQKSLDKVSYEPLRHNGISELPKNFEGPCVLTARELMSR